MRGGDGILGNREVERRNAFVSTTRRKWLKRREIWLVVLGVILHAVYMMSIFDIYFKTPIVHGMDPVAPRFSAPAKRLVLLVGTFYGNSHSTCSSNCLAAVFCSILSFWRKLTWHWIRNGLGSYCVWY